MANGTDYSDIKIPESGSWGASKFLVFNLLIMHGRTLNKIASAQQKMQVRLGVIAGIGGFVGMVLGGVAAPLLKAWVTGFISYAVQYIFTQGGRNGIF